MPPPVSTASLAPSPVNPGQGILHALRRAMVGVPRARLPDVGLVHELPKGRTLALQKPLGVVIDCLDGCLWITFDHNRRDVIMTAGETYIADRKQRAVIHALGTSRVRVTRPASRRPWRKSNR